MDASKAAAARALIVARSALIEADYVAALAREAFIAAEEAFCKASEKGDAQLCVALNPVVDGVAILLADEWYDAKPGSRVQFHTVEVVS